MTADYSFIPLKIQTYKDTTVKTIIYPASLNLFLNLYTPSNSLNSSNFKLFKLINAVMSSTMTGYSPMLNAERGTLNTELFKPFKLQTLQTCLLTLSCLRR